MGGMTVPLSLTQLSYRHRVGTILSVINAAFSGDLGLNTARTVDVDGADELVRFRVVLQGNSDVNDSATTGAQGYVLRWRRNATGTFVNVATGADQPVVPAGSAQTGYTEDAGTLTVAGATGTGTFKAGRGTKDDAAVSTTWDASGEQWTAHEFSVLIKHAWTGGSAQNGDFFDFRIYTASGAELTTYAQTVRVNVAVPVTPPEWGDMIHPADNSHVPPIEVGGTYYGVGVDSNAPWSFGIFKTTTPGTPASWEFVAGDESHNGETIGALAWVLAGSTIHLAAKDASQPGGVDYWSLDTSTDTLSSRELVSDAPQDDFPEQASVDIAVISGEPNAVYSAHWGIDTTATEWRHRDTPVGGQWTGIEDFLSEASEAARAGRIVSDGTNQYAFWTDADFLTTGFYVAYNRSDNAFQWDGANPLSAVPLYTYLHELSNAVKFGSDAGVAYLDENGQLSFVGVSAGSELITTEAPNVSSSTLSVSLVVDGDGNVHALIVLIDGSIQHSMRSGADTWSALTEVVGSGAANTVHAAWFDGVIAFTYDDGTGLIYDEFTPGTPAFNLTPAAATAEAVPLDPVPQPVTVVLTPAEATGSAVALDPQAVGAAVDLTPAEATATAVALDPVPQPVQVALIPAEATGTGVGLDPAPGAVAVALTPAEASAAAVALVPGAGAASTDLTPATATGTAVPLDAVPQAVVVALTPAEASALAVALDPAPGLVTVALTPAEATANAVALSPGAGATQVDLAPATATGAAVALNPVPQAVQVDLTPAAATGSGVALDPEPGLVTVALTPAAASAIAVPLDPVTTGAINLTPAQATATAVPLDPVPGAVSVDLTPADATATAVVLSPGAGATTVNLTPAEATATAPALDPAPLPVQMDLTPAGATATAVPVAPSGTGAVNLVPAVATATGVPLDPSPGLVTTTLVPAEATSSAPALDPLGLPGVATLTPAETTGQAAILAPVPLAPAVTLVPATATGQAVPLSTTAGLVTVVLAPAEATAVAVPVHLGAISKLKLTGMRPIRPIGGLRPIQFLADPRPIMPGADSRPIR